MPILTGGNVMPGADAPVADMTASSAWKLARYKYDFAVDGGVAGAINMSGDTLPIGAIIMGGLLDVQTIPTSSGSATIAISVQAANDVVTAAAYDGAPWSTTGRKSIIPVFTGATSLKVATTAKYIVATIGAADLTAGVFEVHLWYYLTA